MMTRTPRLTSAGVAMFLAFVLGTSAAQASISEIGSFGSGELSVPGSLAVDQISGDVYVTDEAAERVVKFGPSGTFILMFGKNVDATKVHESEEGKAVSQAEEDLCTAASGDECQDGVKASGPGQFNRPESIAVDPNNGDVYVNDRNNERIEKFNSAGNYVSQIDSGIGGAPLLPFEVEMSTDSEGDLYIAANEAGYAIEIGKFDPSGVYSQIARVGTRNGSPPMAVDPEGFIYLGGFPVVGAVNKLTFAGEAITAFTAPPGYTDASFPTIAVDLASGDIFFEAALKEAQYIAEIGPAGEQLAQIPLSIPGLGAIGYDTLEGRLYKLSSTAAEVSIYGTFPVPVAQAPTVADESLSAFGLSSARIVAHIDPHLLDTTYYFQYATNPSFTGAVDTPASPGEIGTGFLDREVVAELTGLQPSTVYYYRVLAHNAYGGGNGSTATGPTQKFTTFAPVPAVSTEAVSEITFDSATLHGTVSPGSVGVASDTRWCFEYGSGSSTAYDLGSVPLIPGDAGQGASAVPVSVHVAGLTPGSTYRYRLIAVNSLHMGLGSTACATEGGHETDGAEGVFTTPLTFPAPIAVTGAVGGVSQNAATISGTVDPQGFRTSYEFQLGADTSYGVQVFGEAGEGDEAKPVSLTLGYLQPDTTYHYRLVAISSTGTSYGADATFTTPGFSTAALSAPASASLIAAPRMAFPSEAKTEVTGGAKARGAKGKKKRKPKRRKRGKPRKTGHGRKAGLAGSRGGQGRAGG